MTVHQLLHMTSGVPDYDGEKFAKAQFGNRSRAFGPIEIILGYVDREPDWEPGTNQVSPKRAATIPPSYVLYSRITVHGCITYEICEHVIPSLLS